MRRWNGNKADLAEFFQVSAPTIDDWVRRECPFVTRGRSGVDWVFDFRAVRRWREAYIVTHAGRSKDTTRAHAIRRRALAEARLKEIELATVEGSLVDADLIRRGLDGVMINQRTILMSLPSQIGRDIDEPELRVRTVAIVDRRVREALEVLSRYDPAIEQDAADEAGHNADAAEPAIDLPVRKPVRRKPCK